MSANPNKLEEQWQKFKLEISSTKDLGQIKLANLKLLEPKGVMGDLLIISAPSEATRKTVQEPKVYDAMKVAVHKVFGPVTPQIIVEEPVEELTETDDGQLFDLTPEKATVKKKDIKNLQAVGQLNPRYTFENFIFGSSNRFAYSAATAVADAPAKAYNPLFIYGRSGLGKTHLLHAIGHYALEHYADQDIKVLYVNSEKYTNDFINSISSEKAKKEFKKTYRNLDFLLIDDIQFLAKKNTTQEEFFHTFNTLLEGSKQVVITSDVPPKDLHSFEERLRSRFEQGLMVDVIPPSLETRIAILRHKNRLENLNVPDDIIELIASKVSTNIRELEGSLITVSAYASLNDVPITKSLTETALKQVVSDSTDIMISLDKIIRETAEYFDLTAEELRGKSRVRSIAFPRQIAMYLCRELSSDMTLGDIGKEFGGKDHTTVMHAVKRVSSFMKTDKKIYDQITEITVRIQE
ncbi:MAG: chromosomal replication initiator protein DnaA [Micrococcaceae bacterium]